MEWNICDTNALCMEIVRPLDPSSLPRCFRLLFSNNYVCLDEPNLSSAIPLKAPAFLAWWKIPTHWIAFLC